MWRGHSSKTWTCEEDIRQRRESVKRTFRALGIRTQTKQLRLDDYLSLHNSFPFNSYTASSASLWSSNSWRESPQSLEATNQIGPVIVIYIEWSVTLTTKPNPFFKLISRIRPYPLKNFSTSLSRACGLKRPMKTRQPLMLFSGGNGKRHVR